MLHDFQHTPPKRAQHSPHLAPIIQYGAAQQLTPTADTSPPLDPKGITRIQQIIGTLMRYVCAVDGTLHVALGTIAAQQTTAT